MHPYNHKRTESFAVFSSVASNDRDRDEYDKFLAMEYNFVILTNAGKPVYSLHGDIYSLSSVYATLYAIISKMQTFKFKPIDLSLPQPAAEVDSPARHLRSGNFGMGNYSQ